MKKSDMLFRPSTLEERKRYYKEEFSINKVKEWFRQCNAGIPQLCAIDAGTETGIICDKKQKGYLLYFPFRELRKKIKKYVPEDVYYDRNYYTDPDKVLRTLRFGRWIGQELVFDIDAENINCRYSNKKVCNVCIRKSFFWAKKLKTELEEEFKLVRLVYSGRGFHIHVLDKNAYGLSIKERAMLNKKFAKYPIDPWVSGGRIELIRMPYTLNSQVSRKVIPLNNIFNKNKTYPKFLFN
jgi:DNA primase catalytic subunit